MFCTIYDLNITFCDDEWCKENRLCVQFELIDMSQNFRITALKSWVIDNCPDLLNDEKYHKFLRIPDEDGYCSKGYGNAEFLEYNADNFGCHICKYEEDY